MAKQAQPSIHVAWSHLRFSVVGALLSAPPAAGELKTARMTLSQKTWLHPVTGQPVRFAWSTLERWYYQARRARQDPVGVLRRQVRKDAGRQHVVHQRLARVLIEQYQRYKYWSIKLHRDNLAVRVEEDPSLGPMPSYSSVRRFMRAHGLDKQPRRRQQSTPSVARADARLERREVRSFTQAWVEMEYHRTKHRETHQKPLDHFLNGPQIARPSPSIEALRQAFRHEVTRTQ